jgi:hypothetical protein
MVPILMRHRSAAALGTMTNLQLFTKGPEWLLQRVVDQVTDIQSDIEDPEWHLERDADQVVCMMELPGCLDRSTIQ